jgi:hypothetical protein
LPFKELSFINRFFEVKPCLQYAKDRLGLGMPLASHGEKVRIQFAPFLRFSLGVALSVRKLSQFSN